jgi:hypothetical protein
VLFLNREAPANIIQEVGGRKGLSGIMQNALNVESVMYFVRKAASSNVRTVFFRQIWITVRAAAFARMNAGPER